MTMKTTLFGPEYSDKPEVILYGLGRDQVQSIQAIPELTISKEKNIYWDKKINSSITAAEFLREQFGSLIHVQEAFYVIYLNHNFKIIGIVQLSKGGISSTSADRRILFGIGLKILATHIIVSHNHPSGNPEPSQTDINLTEQLINTGKIHDIKVLDHIIITANAHYSFSDNGKLGLQGITTDISSSETLNNSTMITKENLRKILTEEVLSALSAEMQENIQLLKDVTDDLTDFSMAESNDDVRVVLDEVISELNNHHAGPDNKATPVKPETVTVKVKAGRKSQDKKKEPKRIKKEKPVKVKPKKQKSAREGEAVATVSPEVRIIKRYLAMDGKKLGRDKILTFITTLQKLIRSQAIRKTSPYADEIMHIQKELIKVWRKHRNSSSPFDFSLDDTDARIMAKFLQIAKSQRPNKVVQLIKRYFALHGHENVKEKAIKLANEIKAYMNTELKENGAIESSEYWPYIQVVKRSLDDYIDGSTDYPELTNQQLNGFKGLGMIDYNQNLKVGDRVRTGTGAKGKIIRMMDKSVVIDTQPDHYHAKNKAKKINGLSGCPCTPGPSLSGPESGIMAATDFGKLDFTPVGYKGKWLSLIGDPVEPYMLMTWSKPGKGKTTLMIELASYLATEHNKKVLFISKEEGLNHTLKDKFVRLNAFSPNIFIAESLPGDLSKFNYVFLDSVNQLQLSIDDISELKKKFPTVSFVLIFQATVDGNYRGSKDFEHLVDVSVNINDQGFAAAQKTRFGGNGTINVFQEEFEEIYRFTALQDAEKFRDRKRQEGISMRIVQGDDNKIWVVKNDKAEQLYQKGYTIL
jgi:DNA repair protein RadC